MRKKRTRTFVISWMEGIVGCSLTVDCSEIKKIDARSVSVDGAVLHIGHITGIQRSGW